MATRTSTQPVQISPPHQSRLSCRERATHGCARRVILKPFTPLPEIGSDLAHGAAVCHIMRTFLQRVCLARWVFLRLRAVRCGAIISITTPHLSKNARLRPYVSKHPQISFHQMYYSALGQVVLTSSSLCAAFTSQNIHCAGMQRSTYFGAVGREFDKYPFEWRPK